IRLPQGKKVKYNFNLKYAQDTDYFMRYMDQKSFINIEDVLYFYSEFQSVTRLKVLRTKYYGFYNHISIFKKEPILSVFRILKNTAEIAILTAAYPFISDNYLLKRRGQQPSQFHLDEFNK